MVLKTFRIFNSYKEFPTNWDAHVAHDIFLQTRYLEALENAAPDNIQWFYIGVMENDTLVGLVVIQRAQLYLRDMFRKAARSRLKEFFRDLVSRILKGNVLVVGNLTHTGQHALYYDHNKIAPSEFFDLLFKGVEVLTENILKTYGKRIRAVVLKDFFIEDPIFRNRTFFTSKNLHEVRVQPNMMMLLPENWHTMNDYIGSLKKKYRDRYKRARRKLNGIVTKELDLNTTQGCSKWMHELYLNVSDNARFNTFILPQNHFYELKLKLKDKFKVYGYYLNDVLVGFYTLILNGKDLETYFLGYDSKHQYSNQLYLNMLYDMLQFGIENRFDTIVYARTAMAIKSSVGAKPEPMVMYLKHTNPFLNAILYPVFKLMNPAQSWEERHPFKETN